MATPPFSSTLITKLKAATAWRFDSQIGPVFTPRFFCCSDPNELGIVDGKEPVAVLDLDPSPALVGDTVTFDGTDSYDPDGSVTGYDWTFPDGTPDSSSASSGSVTWADTGEYEVELIVTDGTGLTSSPARTIITIWESIKKYYLATNSGVEYTSDGQTWVSKNTGLSGDSLVVNDLKIDPATKYLDELDKTLWIATNGGIYYSFGADDWIQDNPISVTNLWGDTPAPTVDDLAFVKLLFSNGVLFAVANWTNAGGDERSWVFYRGNYSASWDELEGVGT